MAKKSIIICKRQVLCADSDLTNLWQAGCTSPFSTNFDLLEHQYFFIIIIIIIIIKIYWMNGTGARYRVIDEHLNTLANMASLKITAEQSQGRCA